MSEQPSSRLHRPFFRNGPEHRSGADVSFQDIVKIFGFRTVKIGKWVTADEQQIAANLFFDALCDLMDILQVPEQVISLNGQLSLAFGSGGQKHSSAHYDAAARTLALAKNAGGGALAHEWFHAFDHYIASRMFVRPPSGIFASQLWLDDADIHPHPLNDLLSACFKCIFLTLDGEEPNAFMLRSVEADRALGFFYYAQPPELGARAFEAFVQDSPRKNAFLVQGTKQSQEARLGIYPGQDIRGAINDSFNLYFRQLGLALQS